MLSRPPVLVAIAVSILLVLGTLAGGLAGSGQTTGKVDSNTPTATQTLAVVPKSPENPTKTPTVILAVPNLIKVDSCKGISPKGTPVWQWLADGSLIDVKEGKRAITLPQDTTLNGMGLVWQKNQYCFVSTPGAMWRFVQAPKNK